jgi:hypothetical protein
MENEQSGGKRSYEPPRVMRLDAAGAAEGICQPVGSAEFMDCQSGTGARNGCTPGGAAFGVCISGGGY